MSIITVIGSGAMGSALSFPLRDNDHEVRLVGTMLDRAIIEEVRRSGYHHTLKRTLPDGVKGYQLEELDAAIEGAELIVCGVSSFGADWFMRDILHRLPPLPILSVTKGMVLASDGSFISYPALYASKFPGHAFCAIGGPCTSYELADRDQTHICFCGYDMPLLNTLRDVFRTPYYHISLSADVIGVECAVALKNAYALAVTTAVGMALRNSGIEHYNSQAALFGQGVREMRKLLALFGGGDDNIVYGAGDLYVTVFGGRTRLLGTLLGKGIPFQDAVKQLEGVTLESVVIASRTAQAVRVKIEQGLVTADDFPLLLHIDDVINHDAELDIPWEKFTC
ncbi:MAG: glycerol-3-phosphate dehydrogenase [Oscillospiraceae bacterium]|nr:glycerol-3-phosphate dehydrogenase [Oscillospiraceae bacterium]